MQVFLPKRMRFIDSAITIFVILKFNFKQQEWSSFNLSHQCEREISTPSIGEIDSNVRLLANVDCRISENTDIKEAQWPDQRLGKSTNQIWMRNI